VNIAGSNPVGGTKKKTFDMKKISISFIESGSFVGASYSMKVNTTDYFLGLNSEVEAKKKAVEILSSKYGIVRNPNDIKFIWDGTL
jgi:hypothetical protein